MIQFIDRLNQEYRLDSEASDEQEQTSDTRKDVSEFVLLEKRPEPSKNKSTKKNQEASDDEGEDPYA